MARSAGGRHSWSNSDVAVAPDYVVETDRLEPSPDRRAGHELERRRVRR